MATFEITLSDGSVYEVDGLPDNASEQDVYAALQAQLNPPPPTRDAAGQALQWGGVANRALMPYAAAAGAGALAGAPLAGVGAVPGAAAGALALGISDLGVGAYNLAATPFGAPAVTMPSEAIRQAYEKTGLPGMRQPETTPQRIFSTALEAAAPAGATAKALQVGSKALKPGMIRNIATEAGRGAKAQAVGGAASGAATQSAIEGGERDPLKLFLISLAGGVTGSLAAGKTPRSIVTGEDIRSKAGQFYKAAEQQGVYILPNVADGLANQLENTLQRQGASITQRDRAPILRVIRDLRNRQNADLSFEELEKLRSDLGLIGRDPQTGKVVPNTPGAQQNRLAGIVQDKLDDFFDQLDYTQVSSGDPRRALELVKTAREQYKNARKGEILEQVLTDVELKSRKHPPIDVLQSRLEPIVKDKRLMAKFTPEEQEVIKSLQAGTPTENTLAFLGRLSPGTNWKQVLGYAAPASGAAFLQSPAAVGVVGGVAAGSAVARATANRMALTRAADLTQNMFRGLPPGTTAENYMRNVGRIGSTYVPPVIAGSAAADRDNRNALAR